MIGNARIRLRPTLIDDLDFVVGIEQDEANRPWITPWERTQHEAAVRFPDFRHFVVEATDAGRSEPVGFVILIGCRNPNRSIELKRLVIQSKGRGLGRACVRLLKRVAFEDLGAHRFWLDVRLHNTRAQALYDSEGFVEEGLLRECVKTDEGWESLRVMSMLQAEYHARSAAGQENAAA
ncbi:GNAT family N-acetyltransferase [Caldimonas tepidiphila]|uniref:GNAT family N-acetyltransferase n=1 Tax=Caldimonas tepidiphila TaxID=2315841 RepID=UPI000E5B75DB|nr:GNAT family protein [Caldimonas tepidiphila]